MIVIALLSVNRVVIYDNYCFVICQQSGDIR